ncbi:MAG TPA: GYD domain-containing protein, partial [Candidatus Binatia bacterium]
SEAHSVVRKRVPNTAGQSPCLNARRTGFFILRAERTFMATYIALVNFTDQGVRQIRQTTERAKALVNAGSNLGVKIKDIYWTMGAFDAVFTAEAQDDDAIMAFAASMGALGNIRTRTMRAFSAAEMNKILETVPAGNFISAK